MKPTPSDSQVTRLLLLIRHGQAAPKDAGLDDFERVLTAGGAAECRVVGERLRGMSLSVDMMLSSPADRALETAHYFAPFLSIPVQQVRIVPSLYGSGSVRPMMSRLQSLPDTVRTVAVVGHSPSLENLAAHLVLGFDGELPKGGVAGIAVEEGDWKHLRKGIARLHFLLTPRDAGKQVSARRKSLT